MGTEVQLTDEKVRENRLRRVAERRGYRLLKSRRRDPEALDYGGYMLLDAASNTVILGASPRAIFATLEDVEKYSVHHEDRVINVRVTELPREHRKVNLELVGLPREPSR